MTFAGGLLYGVFGGNAVEQLGSCRKLNSKQSGRGLGFQRDSRYSICKPISCLSLSKPTAFREVLRERLSKR